jgi:hypothetical protein
MGEEVMETQGPHEGQGQRMRGSHSARRPRATRSWTGSPGVFWGPSLQQAPNRKPRPPELSGCIAAELTSSMWHFVTQPGTTAGLGDVGVAASSTFRHLHPIVHYPCTSGE